MSQLIQMRRRLKAIETIRKITHAMQLVSMSTHLHLRNKKVNADNYQKTIQKLFRKTLSRTPGWRNHIFQPVAKKGKKLIILVGSQKGLCGTFNTTILHSFKGVIKEQNLEAAELVTIGKKIGEYLSMRTTTLPIKVSESYDQLTQKNLPSIISKLLNKITQAPEPYTSVLIYSNHAATFFLQHQKLTTLIPYITPDNIKIKSLDEPLHWESGQQETIDALALQNLHATLYATILQSFLAEQAARFVSMDGATRNAKTLQESMKLNYNKVRQAKITRELTELNSCL